MPSERRVPLPARLTGLLVLLVGAASGCSSASTADLTEALAGPADGSNRSSAEVPADGTDPAEAADEAGPADDGVGDVPQVTTGPDENSAVRSVVDGFPLELLPLPDDAVVLVTSAVQVGEAEVQEVSLNLRTQSTAAVVLDLYRGTLVEAGFVEVVPERLHADLAEETLFTRSGGDELVSIGVLDDGAGRTVTIGGRIRTEG